MLQDAKDSLKPALENISISLEMLQPYLPSLDTVQPIITPSVISMTSEALTVCDADLSHSL